jgi:SpoVK/Ycf46/Vps4 family AAA+-type ATPase
VHKKRVEEVRAWLERATSSSSSGSAEASAASAAAAAWCPPRLLILMGPPGTGKSTMGKHHYRR